MLIDSISCQKRNEILISEYLKLLKREKAENILYLVQNSKKKKDFIEALKKRMPEGNIGSLKVYSFSGLVYNFILENWAIIENEIKSDKNRKISPNLCGLEVSQYIFKECINEVDFSGYNSKTSLLHQLLRRNSLINFNSLTKEDIEKRTKILQESYSKEVGISLNKYKMKTIETRAFDYVRQINLFEILYKKIKNPFSYVFLDDGDEITPAVVEYLEFIKKDVKNFYIAYDSLGSSRLGYLGAVNVDFEKFLSEKAIKFEKPKNALSILHCVKNDKPIEIENIKNKTFLRYNEMVEQVLDDIKKLIKNGIKPEEIAVVTPQSDEFLKNAFDKSGFKFNFLNKNEKLNQNKLIGYLLELLKIINDKKNGDISPYILKGIFIELLNINKKDAIKIIKEYHIERDFKGLNILDFIKGKNIPSFQKLIEIYQKIHFEKLSLQLLEIVSNFIELRRDLSKDIIKINQLLKQIYDFEEVFNCTVSNLEIINQLENTIISENPLSDDEIDNNSIIVSSAQKIIDYSYKTKYQFLIDCSSQFWIKQDIGPLYNAWVMQKGWTKETYELDDNINLTKDKTARILYKLYLLSENTMLYSSVYDILGGENFCGIDKFFKYKNETKEEKIEPVVPREDQKEVLEYKGGKMSVNAAAGSGKTTIMLLLVEKILCGKILGGIEPKNIFVLTFMESAARNFKERIKTRYPNLEELPNISTIHGLALRIIKENNNYSRLNLDFDFEIADETKRSAIIAQITYASGISPDKVSLYDGAISAYKNELANYPDFICSNKLFLKVYENYQKELREQNLIDYDDLLLLSLKLLRENKDILEYYQNIVKIIIEDEAQDSSATQQNLILLLGGKYKNIVRCGDINQAITSTFTNSDVAGFKEFMKNSKNVLMDRCQRCATGVLNCANNMVLAAKDKKIDAFSNLIMKPVDGVNIIDKFAVSKKIFEEEKNEREFVLKSIKEIIKNDRNALVAILLRNNFSILKWDKYLSENSIKTCNNSGALINNPVFKVCLLILEYISNPFDIKLTQHVAKTLYEYRKYSFNTLKYINNLSEPLFLRDDFDEQFYWDMNYFLYKNYCSIYDLVYEIGSFYFSDTKESANIPLVAAIAQKIRNGQRTFEDAVLKLREIQYKNNFSNIKFFNIEDNSKKSAQVKIMTLHKSKGDEFDYVFIPELTEDNLCLDISKYKLKENSKFTQKVKKETKSDEALKKEIIEENFRLIYVGITRAKKKLFLSASKKYKFYSKVKEAVPAEIFADLS